MHIRLSSTLKEHFDVNQEFSQIYRDRTDLVFGEVLLFGLMLLTVFCWFVSPVSLALGQAVYDSVPQPFDAGVVYERELYVNATASDGGDGSARSPFNNIRDGLTAATPGTRVNVAAGNYPPIGSISNLQGEPTRPIALVGSSGVVIDGGGSSLALGLQDPRYIVLQGLRIQNSFPHGMNLDDGGSYDTPAQYVVLRSVVIGDVGTGGNSDCLKLSGVDNVYVEQSEFYRCNAGEAIDMVGCHNGVITRNLFRDMPRNAVQTKGGSADMLIYGNRFRDIAQRAVNSGGSTGAPYFRPIDSPYEARRIQTVANVFERTASAPVAFVGCDTCVFANNTIIEPSSYIARILEENTNKTPGHNGYFVNNLIVFNVASMSSYSFVNVGVDTRPETYTFSRNLWYALDQSNFSAPPLRGGVPPETNSVVQQNPLLVDRTGGDYHIDSGSPAIGAGGAVLRGVPADYDRRAYLDPPSIGAFAAPGAAFPPSAPTNLRIVPNP